MKYWGVWVVLGLALASSGATGCSSSSSSDSGNDSGGSGPAAGGTGGACLEAGSECTNNVSGCCSGTACVAGVLEEGKGHCAATCDDGGDCVSTCCVPLSTSDDNVCAPEDFCVGPPCTEAGFECADTSECCLGNRCVVDSGSSLGGYCAAECTDGSQCSSGCCAPLDDNVTSVCAPTSACATTPQP